MIDARLLANGQTLSTKVCIVGAGAAGIAMAIEFIGTGIEVLLIEAGALSAETETQSLYAGAVVDAGLHSPPDRYRQRRFGGSTTIWGGRCVPFDAIDFEARTYMAESGWPFGLDTLEPYYARASALCEIGRYSFDATDSLGATARPMLRGFASEHFSSERLERFSCPTDFGKRYHALIANAPNINVLLNANLTDLQLNPSGTSVTRASTRTLTGKTLTIVADHFVLATGGLEVARLLLSNDAVHRNGIGNAHDVVGRYYQCHIAGTVGTLKLADADCVSHGYEMSEEGVYCRRRLSLNPHTQRALGVGNFVARLHHPRITDPAHRTGSLSLLFLAKAFIPYEYGKRLHGEERSTLRNWLRHIANLLSDPIGSCAFLLHWLRHHTLATRKFPSIIVRSKANHYSLDFHAEQEPNPHSRVTLDDTRDALGMRRLRIDWRYTRKDVETVSTAIALLAEEFKRSGIGHFEYDPQGLEFEMTRYGAYGGHHIGTARMGVDPKTSVVDANCRVHGVDNLFIASSATFPTSSQANPTLTIVALSLRLAEHLKQLCSRSQSHSDASPIPINDPGYDLESVSRMKV